MTTFKPLNKRPGRILIQCCRTFEEYENYTPHYLAGRKKRMDARGWDFDRCSRPANYVIEGQYPCQQHAALAALKFMEKNFGEK